MNCKAMEQLILESEERPLEEGERRKVEEHLRACAGCRDFEAGRRDVLEGLKETGRKGLPRSLDLRTRNLCLEALKAGAAGRPDKAGRVRIPVPVIAAAVVFTILAAVWLTATLGDLAPGEPLSATAWLAIAFIARNVLALFLAPVILGAGRPVDVEDTQPGQRI